MQEISCFDGGGGGSAIELSLARRQHAHAQQRWCIYLCLIIDEQHASHAIELGS